MPETGQRQIWVDQARGGDQIAVSKLLATFHSILRARVDKEMGTALKAKMEPEDILQQVYLEVLKQIMRFEGRDPETFLNWILTILDNKLVDTQRALHRQKRDVAREKYPHAVIGNESYFNLLDHLDVHSGTPSRVIRRDEAVGALLASLSHLSDSHRQVIQLRYLQGLSVNETAQKLDKTEAAVVALSGRALEALRTHMDGLGEFTRIS